MNNFGAENPAYCKRVLVVTELIEQDPVSKQCRENKTRNVWQASYPSFVSRIAAHLISLMDFLLDRMGE